MRIGGGNHRFCTGRHFFRLIRSKLRTGSLEVWIGLEVYDRLGRLSDDEK